MTRIFVPFPKDATDEEIVALMLQARADKLTRRQDADEAVRPRSEDEVPEAPSATEVDE